MTHRDFIRGLPRGTLADLSRLSNGPGLRHLAMHVLLILAGGVWIGLGLPFWPLVLIVQGIVLSFLFTLEHEATHRTPFATPWINEWVGRLAGLLIFLPFEWFRHFHLAHHKYTNVPGKDPELIEGAKPETWPAYVLYVSGLRYWSGNARQILRNAFGEKSADDYVPGAARGRVRTEARIMLGVYAVAFASLVFSPVLFWIWILPLVIGQPFLRLYLLAEHGRCAFVANMFENTRTTLTNRAVRFLAWNMPYHVEHHSLPRVPFHRLPDLYRLMQGHHVHLAPSYRSITADLVRTLK
ncbi:MAG: fatty acid desaturase [Pseudomonadota bacterium]